MKEKQSFDIFFLPNWEHYVWMLFHQEELSYISPYALSQFPLDPNIFLQKKIEIILLLRPNYICTIFAQVLCMLLASLLEKNYLVNNMTLKRWVQFLPISLCYQISHNIVMHTYAMPMLLRLVIFPITPSSGGSLMGNIGTSFGILLSKSQLVLDCKSTKCQWRTEASTTFSLMSNRSLIV